MDILHFEGNLDHDSLKKVSDRLYSYSKDKTQAILVRLLSETTAALKNEISQLGSAEQRSFPYFANILHLVHEEGLRRGPLSGAVEGALCCVLELGLFVL